jgi:hypothetical protein
MFELHAKPPFSGTWKIKEVVKRTSTIPLQSWVPSTDPNFTYYNTLRKPLKKDIDHFEQKLKQKEELKQNQQQNQSQQKQKRSENQNESEQNQNEQKSEEKKKDEEKEKQEKV